jgi:hypothetical protein
MCPVGEPHGPAVFLTAVPKWLVSETLMLGDSQRLCSLVIRMEISDELIDQV